ncbi:MULTISPECIES: hypothetical protein [Micromonospora]|uniref:SPW repeat-containing protein n=1 Tax=Micromonospora solifontis TaxID=2487138 RepID=A0ABX9WE99_9ACTN|nr:MULTISPECIES: hypothetical protein [Micromonospora]NES13865.1 hypothetical protein [Micromonospora sp. PPF5-17B]NES37934.1 hypothetical protein [Micromonospora solifontis]NES53965.1 hypothetical protein [Micromonospora sp. PPF5-6]RNL97783.1 hypothetical protein EFE23_17515 [Micromonospora solifontis]
MTTRTLFGGLLLAAATVGTWFAWLSWNTGYRVDPETGATTGPYAVWQVAGCVLTLAVVAAAGGWWLSPWLVGPVMAVAFTVPWAGQAASTDGSGLWAVGAALVLVGTAAGGLVVSLAAHLLRRRLTGG